jgi:diguanylate cyclase (GGDEF)-like protein
VAAATAERIVRAVRDLRIPHPASALGHVTVSAGAAAPAGRRIAPWEVIDEADRALYAAKDAGRDRAMAGGAGAGMTPRSARSDPAA